MTPPCSSYRCLLLLLLLSSAARADPERAQPASETQAQPTSPAAGAAASPSTGETLKQSLEKAQRSADQGAYQDAIQMINILVERYPRLGFSLFICQLHLKALKPALAQECIEHFQSAVRSKQILAPAAMLKIAGEFAETTQRLAHAMNSYDRADLVTALSEFARLRAELPRLSYLCGRAHLALHHYREAADELRSFLAQEQAGEPLLRDTAAALYREALAKSQPPEAGAGAQRPDRRPPLRAAARIGLGAGVVAVLLLGGLAAGLACAQPGACGRDAAPPVAVQAPAGTAAILFHF